MSLTVTRNGLTDVGGKLLSALLGTVIFLVVMIGGGIYRTDCLLSSGRVVTSWGPEGAIPYTWSPSSSNCSAHSLGRYVLGLAGAMSPASSLQDAYTPALIRQVGAGSVAEAQVVSELRSLRSVGGFSSAAAQQSMLYLLRGQLNKLTVGELASLSAQNRVSAAGAPVILAKLNRIAASLAATTGTPDVTRTLPAASKTFVTAWNRYVSGTAGGLRKLAQALTGIKPLYADFDRLIVAAYRTRGSGTTQFAQVRSIVLTDIRSRYPRIQSAQRDFVAHASVEQPLSNALWSNEDGQAILTRVNHDYPNGFLAQSFPHGSAQ